jgi:prevent-host-death family protein
MGAMLRYNVQQMEQVGLRELRLNLRHYLKRARDGAAFEVTEFGRPIARIGPLPRAGSRCAELVAAGRLTPAQHHPSTMPAPMPAPASRSATAELLAERRTDPR